LPETLDRVTTRTPPAGWRSLAVLPFGGDPAHRRPAEELVAMRLRRAGPVSVVAPFAIRSAFPGGGLDAGRAIQDADRWATAYLHAPGEEQPRRELRDLARKLGVDALVVGRVQPGGAMADLVLVDGSTGEAIAAVKRAGDASAASRGIHELAMNATGRAAEDLVTVLQGRTPTLRRPHAPTASEVER
jgi:hypothetical protein